AERAGLDRALQVGCQIGAALAESVEDHLHAARNVLAGALRRGRRASLVSADPHRAGHLALQGAYLLFEACHLLGASPPARRRELLIELAKALAAHGVRLRIEELAWTTRIPTAVLEVLGGRRRCVDPTLGHDLERVTLSPGIAE